MLQKAVLNDLGQAGNMQRAKDSWCWPARAARQLMLMMLAVCQIDACWYLCTNSLLQCFVLEAFAAILRPASHALTNTIPLSSISSKAIVFLPDETKD